MEQPLARGRHAYLASAWGDAFAALSSAERARPLGADDLERLAIAAYMLGRGDEYVGALERAHHLLLDAGEPLAAGRAAFWIGMHLFTSGEVARATGWLGRAQRLIERAGVECAEQGYLLLPLMFQQEAAGDFAAAAAIAARAAAAGERFGDMDLFALAVHGQGHMLIHDGAVADGLRLFDEAMVAVTAGETSPLVSGFVYCGVVLGCQAAYEPRRAQEWTAALSHWCERQPDMVAFTGRCLIHRAELMQLHGAWSNALAEARRAGRRAERANSRPAVGEAAYLRAEVHRLRGQLGAAEDAYREASRWGREPQPGLALLRLAQGRSEAAAAAIRRAVNESRMLHAVVAQARGAVALEDGDAAAALVSLRTAWRGWEELDAPYEAARARQLLGRACRELGDEDAASLELEAASAALAELGAESPAPDDHGLTARELEVLRLVAAGATNKAIAAALVISERTVDRHGRIGDCWRRRFDSLRLYTPARYDGLPGWGFPGDPWAFATKDELADYLEAYVERFELPVMTGVGVERLSREGERYVLRSGERRFQADDGRPARVAMRVLWFMANRVLTMRTPLGRRMRPEIRAHGGPLLRYKTADLLAAGVERTDARVAGVRDGRPLLGDGRVVDVANLIWCTGFGKEIGWIDLPVAGPDGWPEQERGVVPDWPGLYFVGLPFLHAFGSMLVGGVGRDAARVAQHIAANAPS